MCALWSPQRPASSWSPKCESSGWQHERVRKGGGVDGWASPNRCCGAAGAGGRGSRPSALCVVAERGNRMSEFGKVAVLMGGRGRVGAAEQLVREGEAAAHQRGAWLRNAGIA